MKPGCSVAVVRDGRAIPAGYAPRQGGRSDSIFVIRYVGRKPCRDDRRLDLTASCETRDGGRP